jgi:hypothetical protein
MSEQEYEEVEVDPNHPWVVASTVGGPQAQPCNVSIDPVRIPSGEEGKTMKAAMISIVDGTGIKNAFITPMMLINVVEQAQAIFNHWDAQQKQEPQGLIIATPAEQHAAQAHADRQQEAEKIIKGKK